MSGDLNFDSLFDDVPKETIMEEESRVHPSEIKDENGNVIADLVKIKDPGTQVLDTSDNLPNVETPVQEAPSINDVIDFDKIPKEQHAQMMELAKLMNIKTINAPAVLSNLPLSKPKKATSLEIFDEGMAGDMKDAKTFWRASRRKIGKDILFDGIPIASQFEDQIEEALKDKFPDIADEDFHFYCYVFFAVSIPVMFTREKYSRSILLPADFNRIMSKEVREKLGIDVVFTTFGSRSDALWWKAYKVASQDEVSVAIEDVYKLIEEAKKIQYTITVKEPEGGNKI